MAKSIIDTLQEEPQGITLSSLMLAWFNSLPEPAWIKIYNPILDKFRMGLINIAYTTMTGISKTDYVYNEDHVVWDQPTSDLYEKADRFILGTKKSHIFDEIVGEFHWHGPKWPVFSGNEVIAVAGMMKDLNG